ncbi:MAG TPA: hypothetical protein DD835_09165, partial [Halomonas sp.]|nr:hypothetical protein [Halomonas sp.]
MKQSIWAFFRLQQSECLIRKTPHHGGVISKKEALEVRLGGRASYLQVFQSFGGLSDYLTTHVDAGAFPKNPHRFIELCNG